jgi:S1-C subfamily serine protease
MITVTSAGVPRVPGERRDPAHRLPLVGAGRVRARPSPPGSAGARLRSLLAAAASLAVLWAAGPTAALAASPPHTTLIAHTASTAATPSHGASSSSTAAPPSASGGTAAPDAGPLAATRAEADLAATIYSQVRPGIVLIEALQAGTGSGASQGSGQQEDQGTGFVIAGGDVVTADHVVAGASHIFITYSQGPAVPAKVVGEDPSDDLALLRVTPPSGVQPLALTLGRSSAAAPGDPVVIVGDPLGYVDTVTGGVISGVGGDSRDLSGEDGHLIHNVIQTDAMVAPGSSGSPVFDASGHVIGVVDATGGTGIGLAIPIDTLSHVLPQLKVGAAIVYPWIGVDVTTIDAVAAIVEGLPVNSGVLVTNVTTGGPADMAGLHAASFDNGGTYQSGTILVSANGQPLTSVAQLSREVDATGIGVPLNLGVWTKTGTKTITVWPAPWPNEAP